MSPHAIQAAPPGASSGRAPARPGWSAIAAASAFRSSETIFACPDCGKGLDIAYDYELAARRIQGGAPLASARRTSGNSRSCCRSSDAARAVAGGAVLRLHATDPRRPPRRGAGPRQPLPEGRLDLAAEPLLQGPRGVDVGGPAARARRTRDRLRLDRQRGHRGRLAGGEGGRRRHTSSTRTRLEDTKARACRALGAKVCQVEGNYDEVNRRCREVAEATGMEFANITLRPFYAEGAKTAAFEIVEQLDWQSPGAHRHRRPPAARCPRASTRASASCSCWGSRRPTRRSSTSRSRAAATRSRARSSRRRRRSSRSSPRRRRTRWRSAHRATATW